MLTLIAAISLNGVIGHESELYPPLPWHLPEDLRHFRDTTVGGTVIMGRKTFEALGKPLEGRRNVVLTRSKGVVIEGAETITGANVARTRASIRMLDSGRAFVIGGAQTYECALRTGLVDRMVISHVHQTISAFEGRLVYMPPIDWSQWEASAGPDRRDGFAIQEYTKR